MTFSIIFPLKISELETANSSSVAEVRRLNSIIKELAEDNRQLSAKSKTQLDLAAKEHNQSVKHFQVLLGGVKPHIKQGEH